MKIIFEARFQPGCLVAVLRSKVEGGVQAAGFQVKNTLKVFFGLFCFEVFFWIILKFFFEAFRQKVKVKTKVKLKNQAGEI